MYIYVQLNIYVCIIYLYKPNIFASLCGYIYICVYMHTERHRISVSLFTNIPLDETISICANFLYCSPSTASLPFPEAVFIELMGIATKSLSFSFNETMFCQIDGVSMGSALGPIQANIFVGFHERRLFDRFPKPFIY